MTTPRAPPDGPLGPHSAASWHWLIKPTDVWVHPPPYSTPTTDGDRSALLLGSVAHSNDAWDRLALTRESPWDRKSMDNLEFFRYEIVSCLDWVAWSGCAKSYQFFFRNCIQMGRKGPAHLERAESSCEWRSQIFLKLDPYPASALKLHLWRSTDAIWAWCALD